MRAKGIFPTTPSKPSLLAFARPLGLLAVSLALAACGSGGAAGGSSSSSGTGSSTTPSTTAPTGFAATSAQQEPLGCKPKQVVSEGGYSTCNIEWLGRLAIPGTTIGAKLIENTFYLSNFGNGFFAFDVSTPENPKQLSNLRVDLGRVLDGTTVSLVENEDTATNGKIAILSRRPMMDAVVIDNSNPRAMKILATVPGAIAHTYTCLDDCRYAYGSDTGTIVDLRDPTKPVLLRNKWWDVTGGVSAHDLTEVAPGFVAVSADPASFLDTRDPANPKLIFSLPKAPPPLLPVNVISSQQPGPIGHNILWPRQGTDKFMMGLSEGAYVGRCEVFPLDGRTLYLYDTTDWQNTGSMKLRSSYTLVSGNIADTTNGGGIEGIDSNGNPSTLELGVQGCSVHWFEPHPNFSNGGLLAMASFSHGVRMLKVTEQGQFKQMGYFIPHGIASTVAVYWITDRIFYALDFINGQIDVLQYNGPL
ncbi:MAG: hypothetical protein QE278_05185 [Limnobacter sp.]|nr:hypothetical protein [Limnobacter sp.]